MTGKKLSWQSKAVLIAVLPFAAIHAVFGSLTWWNEAPPVVIGTLGLSALLGLVTWKLRAASPAGALAGTFITASLMYSTAQAAYQPWHTALLPVLAVAVLAAVSTRFGRRRKEQLGTGEERHGRAASQVAANLGFAALAASSPVLFWLVDRPGLWNATHPLEQLACLPLAALAEAAADTVSSEIGQVIGGTPRMITTLRIAKPGQDGAISVAGTLAGIVAALLVASAGTWAMEGSLKMFWVTSASAVFGLLFDSLLGATLEEWGLLNNDAVNFISTASASAAALFILTALPQ